MKVFIAYDGSENADKALNWYFANLHREENEVIVYRHVDAPNLSIAVYGAIPATAHHEVGRIVRDHQSKCLNLKNALTEKLKGKEANVRVVVETEDEGAGHSIVRKAEAVKSDIIVTGTRGLSKLRRTVLGSVSDYILHHTKIPVTVVHC